MNRYLIIVERTSTGFSAYSPDVPGCVATGSTRSKVEREMQDAIRFTLKVFVQPGKRSLCRDLTPRIARWRPRDRPKS